MENPFGMFQSHLAAGRAWWDGGQGGDSAQPWSSDTPRGACLSFVLPAGSQEWHWGRERGHGDPQPPAAPGAHREESNGAGQGQASIPAPIPTLIPTSSFLGCQMLPGSTGIWFLSPVSFNSPAQLCVSHKSIAGIGMNWVWVTFWMCPGKFSGLGEGRAVGIWAEKAKFGLSGEAAWKSCSGMIPPWVPRGAGIIPWHCPFPGLSCQPCPGYKTPPEPHILSSPQIYSQI